jgi:hypothetical protein
MFLYELGLGERGREVVAIPTVLRLIEACVYRYAGLLGQNHRTFSFIAALNFHKSLILHCDAREAIR